MSFIADSALDKHRHGRVPLSLDPAGELLALTTRGEIKNVILGALHLKGPLDLEAMRKAIEIAGDAYPNCRRTLREFRKRGRHYLQWNDRVSLEIPFAFWNRSKERLSGSNLDLFLDTVESSLARERDLFGEPACEVHLVRIGQCDHILGCIMSHVAADAITLSEIVKEFVATYHRIVTGEKQVVAGISISTSAMRKRAVEEKKTVWTDYWHTFRHALIPYLGCTLPGGRGNSEPLGEHHVKALLPQEESGKIVADSLRSRVALVDYLLANMTLAIASWNDMRKIHSASITAAMTVNMQGRFQDRDGPNNDSVLYFRVGPDQRKNARMLAKWFFHSRISLFRRQMDLKYSKAINKLNNFFRILPYKQRQKLSVQILQRHQTSFALGFMGVLWPEPNGRKMSGNSYLTSAGSLTIAEVHGMAYKLLSSTPLYLSAYFFQGELNLILSAAARQFTKAEAQAFLDLLVCTLNQPSAGTSRK